MTLNDLKIESGTVDPGIIFEKGLSKEHYFNSLLPKMLVERTLFREFRKILKYSLYLNRCLIYYIRF